MDYYRVLGVSDAATGAEIKVAYHAAAKRAHPDTGGNAVAMEKVNKAYGILSDPAQRRRYDHDRIVARAPRQTAPHSATVQREPLTHTEVREAAEAEAKRDPSYRQALRAARVSAGRMLWYNLLAAVIFGTAAPYLANTVTSRAAKVIFALVAFAPLYLTGIALIFLVRPRLRLTLAVLGTRGFHPDRSDVEALFAMVIAAVPLALIWIWLFQLGVVK